MVPRALNRFRAEAAAWSGRLAAQAVAASKPIVGASLTDTIAASGGRLSVTVYSDSLEVSALVPSSRARDVIKKMTTAYFAPVLTDEGFGIAQRDGAVEAVFSAADVSNVVRDAVFAALFRDGPQHFPTFADTTSISALTSSDARDFAVRAFRSSNATLVISGAVDPSVVSAAAAGRSDDDATPEAPRTGSVTAAHSPVAQTFAQPAGGLGWAGPPILDERAATAMDFISDYLFRPQTGTVASEIARREPDVVLVGQFITLHDPGVMFVAYGGEGSSAVSGVISTALAAVERPLPVTTFAAARAAFEFHLLSDLQTPAQLADALGWYTVEGDPAYAPDANAEHGAYFAAADSLTPAYVAAVARKYLAAAPALVTFGPSAPKKP
jgi:predicted Zn-dependent peptidase